MDVKNGGRIFCCGGRGSLIPQRMAHFGTMPLRRGSKRACQFATDVGAQREAQYSCMRKRWNPPRRTQTGQNDTSFSSEMRHAHPTALHTRPTGIQKNHRSEKSYLTITAFPFTEEAYMASEICWTISACSMPVLGARCSRMAPAKSVTGPLCTRWVSVSSWPSQIILD